MLNKSFKKRCFQGRVEGANGKECNEHIVAITAESFTGLCLADLV